MKPHLTNKIQSAFLSTGFSDSVYHLLLAVLGILLILILWYLYNRFFVKRDYTSVTTITSPEEINRLFINAITRRSRFEMIFETSGNRKEIMRCTLMNIRNNMLILDAPFTLTGKVNLVGKTVTCYFYIPGKDKYAVFYNFTATTLKQYNHTGQLTQIGISFPESVSLGQKRNFLRVQSSFPDTPLEGVKILRIWSMQLDGDRLKKEVKTWGPPFLNDKKDIFWTEDISQGGLKLVIQDGKKYETILQATSMLFVYFSVKQHDKEKVLHYMTNCQIRSSAFNEKTKTLILGLQFIDQAKATQKPGWVEWERVDPENGIEAVGNWAFLFHIHEHRRNNRLNN